MVLQNWRSHLSCYLFYYPVECIIKQKNPNISTFIPTTKVHNKYKPNLELESFYSLMKKITRFKVIKNKINNSVIYLFIYLIFICSM